MIVTPFLPGHFEALMARIDAKVELLAQTNARVFGRTLFRPGLCYSMLDGGKVYGCGGIIPIHGGTGDAWAAFSQDMEPGASRRWVRVHKEVKRFLDAQLNKDFHRIQTFVQSDFEHGHRWALKLGFGDPAFMEAWGPNGEDFHLYRMLR